MRIAVYIFLLIILIVAWIKFFPILMKAFETAGLDDNNENKN